MKSFSCIGAIHSTKKEFGRGASGNIRCAQILMLPPYGFLAAH
jgi:hypothetical protein